MRIRVFTPNDNGKIEFTKEELEHLLNEAYEEGRREAYLNYYTTTTTNLPPNLTCEGYRSTSGTITTTLSNENPVYRTSCVSSDTYSPIDCKVHFNTREFVDK